MQYCKRCLYPQNHPLGICIDEDGVCSGCRIHEEKYSINWLEKGKELDKLFSKYKNRSGSFYDCVIPVTGNSDSFFVVDVVKNRYGLNPLLVTYNTQFNTKVGVRNLARLITKLDCDHMMLTASPDIVKEITKIAMHKIGDMYWHVLAGSQTFPVQVATKFNIPLVVWGVNGWLDQVGMFSHYDRVEMTKKVRKEHSLRTMDVDELFYGESQLTWKDKQPFTYPSDKQLEKSRVRGIYLGNFLSWDAQKQSEEMINKFGYETLEQPRTFNTYESIYCWNNAGTHDYIKFLKFGYGKATDHASRDIRLKRLSREDGIRLVHNFDDKVPSASLKLFLDWINMTKEEFYKIIDFFRDPLVWEKDNNGIYIRLDKIENHISDSNVDNVRLTITKPKKYFNTLLLESEDEKEGYILMGRGYIDEYNFKAIKG
jgi:N-acetyl sugar amidotransferase